MCNSTTVQLTTHKISSCVPKTSSTLSAGLEARRVHVDSSIKVILLHSNSCAVRFGGIERSSNRFVSLNYMLAAIFDIFCQFLCSFEYFHKSVFEVALIGFLSSYRHCLLDTPQPYIWNSLRLPYNWIDDKKCCRIAAIAIDGDLYLV